MANRVDYAPSHGGRYAAGEPHLIVIHSLEAPARRGLAWSLAGGWIKTGGVSPHAMTDPGETVETCPENIVGWHCGNGNQRSVGFEHTGYAAWSSEQWTTGEAWAALRLGAKRVAEASTRLRIPLRWLSLGQIRAGERGVCTHFDISRTFGGTTHTDPGPGFPYEAFMRTAVQWQGGTGGGGNPDPQPGGGQGGAEGEITVAEADRIINELRYGFDKIMEGKGGEAPDHNVRQVKEMLADALNRISALEARIFNRDPGSQSIVDEIHYGNDQIMGRLPK